MLTKQRIQQIALDLPEIPEPGWLIKFARSIESAACTERDARIAELTRRLEEARKDAERLTAERDSAWEALAMIGDFAHDRSTGPAVPDALWEVRAMAYTAAELAIDTAMKEQT